MMPARRNPAACPQPRESAGKHLEPVIIWWCGRMGCCCCCFRGARNQPAKQCAGSLLSGCGWMISMIIGGDACVRTQMFSLWMCAGKHKLALGYNQTCTYTHPHRHLCPSTLCLDKQTCAGICTTSKNRIHTHTHARTHA